MLQCIVIQACRKQQCANLSHTESSRTMLRMCYKGGLACVCFHRAGAVAHVRSDCVLVFFPQVLFSGVYASILSCIRQILHR